jgi:ubiquinone/menaquinone biosynthesis C-methylase UbiE
MDGMSFPELYERWLVGPIFQPWATIALDRAGVAAGDRMLDIACGTGIVARLAIQRLSGKARVVGVDTSRGMLDLARAIEPAVDWREGNAAALPVNDPERYDVVVCNQGLQFFDDRSASVHEMRRVTAPGGRLAVVVWKSLEDTPFFNELHQLAEQRLGMFVDRRHSLGDPRALQELIAHAGFADVRVEGLSLTIRLPDPAMFVQLNSRAVVGMSTTGSTMSREERARLSDLIAQDSARIVRRYATSGGLAFELGANVATARV